MSGIQDPIQTTSVLRYAAVGALSVGGAAYFAGLPGDPLMYAGAGAAALVLAQSLQANASGKMESMVMSDPVVTGATAAGIAFLNGGPPLMAALYAGVGEMVAYELVSRVL